jgi:branched-chain amino acid transport system ATP-binding protein
LAISYAGLEIAHLIAGYDRTAPVLRDITLSVRPGAIVGVIGPNGSGKSTLLNAISGFARRFEGSILLNGTDLSRMAPAEIARSGVTYVAQERALFPFLSVSDNLELAGWRFSRRADRAERLKRVFEAFPVLQDKRRDKAGVLSGGEQRQLEFARALMRESGAVLLDEPSTGLTPKVTQLLYRLIQRMRRPDLCVLVVDQNVKAVMAIADRIVELRNGALSREIDPTTADARTVVGEWLSPTEIKEAANRN